MDLSILFMFLFFGILLVLEVPIAFALAGQRTAVPAGVSGGAAHHRGAAHGAWYRQLPALGGPFVHSGRPTAQHRRYRRSHLPLCPCPRRAHPRRTRSLQRGGQHDLLGHVRCGAGGCSGPRAHRDQGPLHPPALRRTWPRRSCWPPRCSERFPRRMCPTRVWGKAENAISDTGSVEQLTCQNK